MAYTKQTWANLPSKTTPLSAARLNHMEDGIYTADQNAGTAISGLTNKVDSVPGNGLSTNDFTNAYKTKLDGLYAVTINGTQIEF